MNYMEQITLEQYRHLLLVARKLAAQHEVGRLCEIILDEAMQLTNADGGTLYLLEGYGDTTRLEFAILRNYSLGLRQNSASSGFSYTAVPLFVDDAANHANVASHCAISGQVINITDVYNEAGFDFSGTRKFDQQFGYRTCSVLTLPLLTDGGELIGVLQLLNARDAGGKVKAFATDEVPVIAALSEFAAVAVQKQRALHDQQELLITLAGEPTTQRMLVKILQQAQSIAHADGGTLYLLREIDGRPVLDFRLMRNESLAIDLGSGGELPSLQPIELYLADGQENHHHIAAHTALSKQLVNIPDSYDVTVGDFDFSGTHAFDQEHGYRSVSLLSIPLLNHSDDVIGVLQLVNAQNPQSGQVTAFSPQLEPLLKALASYAAIALNNLLLVQEHKNLLNAFIQTIAKAIDAKSKHTSGHCQRVPLLTKLLAEAACADENKFADFKLDDDGWYELHVASWLHDCGKLATPDFILDKSSKLHTLHDRIHNIEARFAALRQQMQAEYWQLRCSLESTEERAVLEQQHAQQILKLTEQLDFLRQTNQGSRPMTAADCQRVAEIAAMRWPDADGEQQNMLTEDEVYNLCIERGTLNKEERQVINDHIVVTIDMLNELPFPRKLSRVPEYAGGHHEKVDGSGFPKGLTGEQMSLPAKMMAIADIFEALTAKDRPYKDPMPVSKALQIMQGMSESGHIDKDLYELFVQARVWRTYGEQELMPEQLDC